MVENEFLIGVLDVGKEDILGQADLPNVPWILLMKVTNHNAKV